MLLFVYTTTHKGFVIFKWRYFKISWNTTALSQSNCGNFWCSRINIEIIWRETKITSELAGGLSYREWNYCKSMKEIVRSSYREVPVSEGSSYQESTVVSGIPDSLSCILDSKAHDSRFHNSNGFQWDSLIGFSAARETTSGFVWFVLTLDRGTPPWIDPTGVCSAWLILTLQVQTVLWDRFSILFLGDPVCWSIL